MVVVGVGLLGVKEGDCCGGGWSEVIGGDGCLVDKRIKGGGKWWLFSGGGGEKVWKTT